MSTLLSLGALGLCLLTLLRPALVSRPEWRATITPLASIIGALAASLAAVLIIARPAG